MNQKPHWRNQKPHWRNQKPHWQRARVIKASSVPRFVGAEIWVEIGRPVSAKGWDVESGSRRTARLVYELALTSGDQQMVIDVEQVELLARDENDFAEYVPLIPWSEYRKKFD